MERHFFSRPLRIFRFVIPVGAGFALLAGSLSGAQAPAATAAPAQATAPLKPGDAANGKALYNAHRCWACHGSLGRAGGAAPAITPSTRSDEDLIRYLRKPAGNMPPYTSKVVSEQDLADIAAYLRTIPPGTPDPKTIPLLNEINK
jgi:ubiquinol-cytochrome c reductase cytochrome c subunit